MTFEEALEMIEKEFETRYEAPDCRVLRVNLTYDGVNGIYVALCDDGGEIILTDEGYTKDVFWQVNYEEDWEPLCKKHGFSFNRWHIERPFKGMRDVYDFIDFLMVIADAYCPI